MKFKIGSNVKVKSKGTEYSGEVLPSTDNETLFLKLENGYNVGLAIKSISSSSSLKSAKKSSKNPKKQEKQNPKLPKISIITTGGTIASKVEYKTGAVAPLESPQELLSSVPQLKKKINIADVISPISILSENVTFEDWQKLAEFVARELNEGKEGVIVLHGTDTMHYTSAALSFMLENLNKPVAIVGSQRSSDRGSFDGAENLLCAAEYAKSDIAEVSVIMHASSSDNKCLAIPGTKARKMHTTRRDAFRPINSFPFAEITPAGKITKIFDYNKKSKGKVNVNISFEPKIALIKIHPEISADILNFYIDKGFKGIIFEGTGMGHMPLNDSWKSALRIAKRRNIFIGMTSQCLYGTTNPNVYQTGRELEELGIVYLKDILPETAFVKLGCILGRTNNFVKVKELMLQNLKGEFNSRLTKSQYLY